MIGVLSCFWTSPWHCLRCQCFRRQALAFWTSEILGTWRNLDLKSGRYRVEVERIWCFWQLQLPRRFKKQDNQLRWSPPEREIFQKLPCRFSGNQNGNIYPSRLAIAILDCHIGLPRGQPHFFSWLNHRDVGGEKKHFDHFWSSTNIYIPRIKRFFSPTTRPIVGGNILWSPTFSSTSRQVPVTLTDCQLRHGTNYQLVTYIEDGVWLGRKPPMAFYMVPLGDQTWFNGTSLYCSLMFPLTPPFREFPSHVWWHRRVPESSNAKSLFLDNLCIS